jgi:hypothetical protein
LLGVGSLRYVKISFKRYKSSPLGRRYFNKKK